MKSLLLWLFCTIGVTGLQADFQSHSSAITLEIQERMRYSWKENNPIKLNNLRYITVSHWGFDGQIHKGELVVHKNLASEVIEIFEGLYQAKFPIEKMILIDHYFADDESSMEDNNTSAFHSRLVTGRADRFSKHSYGMAIDINPKINPYVKGETILPKSGKMYLDRTLNTPGIINVNSSCYKIFKQKGWTWGGDWTDLKDYQHFEKEVDIQSVTYESLEEDVR